MPEYVPSEGLVAWYGLNGNLDDGWGDANLNSFGGDVFESGRFGENDKAFKFNGNSSFLKTSSALLNSGQNHSILIWFRSEDYFSGGQNFFNTAGAGDCGDDHTISSFALNPIGFPVVGSPFIGFCLGNGSTWNLTCQSQAFPVVLEDTWNLFSLTKDNLLWTVFLNGQEVFSFVAAGNVQDASTFLNFGNVSACGASEYFNGLFDEIGLWQKTLSAQEIDELYQNGLPIGGCTDQDACNFDADATLDDGSCLDCSLFAAKCGPGTIWNAEMQMCIGDGSGDINLDGCVQLNDLLDLLGAYGNCGTDESVWQCGDPLEYQGYDYETVQIEEQCWFAENLKSQQFSNGEFLDELYDNDDWVNATSSAYSVLDQELLYNGFTTMDDRGICPAGWSPGSNSDWSELADSQGGASIAGTALKDSTSGGTNDSGFGGLMVGYRTYWNGEFLNQGSNAYFWTTTTNENGIQYDVRLSSSSPALTGGPNSTSEDGFSIRCIQDSE